MKRRKFIKYTLILGAVPVVAGVTAYELYNTFQSPDYDYLLKRKPLISELCETIIPRTDTPGAKDAGVEDFVVYMIREQVSRQDANNFITGLKKLESYCQKKLGHPFTELGSEQRLKVLGKMERLSNAGYLKKMEKIKERLTGAGFIQTLKSLTVTGFCMSETGATQYLAYDHIPVYLEPCIPLKDGQPSWATK